MHVALSGAVVSMPDTMIPSVHDAEQPALRVLLVAPRDARARTWWKAIAGHDGVELLAQVDNATDGANAARSFQPDFIVFAGSLGREALEKINWNGPREPALELAPPPSSVPPPPAARALDPQEASRAARLTPREREVVGLVGEGLKNKVIASRLGLSESTVRHHLTSIFEKLGVVDRLELVVLSFKLGLVSLPG